MLFSDALDTINEWIADNTSGPLDKLASSLNDIREDRYGSDCKSEYQE